MNQSLKSFEWWYLTAVVYDASGNLYFLFWCDFNYTGKGHIDRDLPQLSGKIKDEQCVFISLASFTDYTNQYHLGAFDIAVMDDKSCFDDAANAKLYKSQKRQSTWSLGENKGHLNLQSEVYNCDLQLSNTGSIMYSKDKHGIPGFIQEGAENDFSFYYSLPRLFIQGTLSFTNKTGILKTIDVTGQGWIDRQWDEWYTYHWEWGSFRFNNGARLNLYNFTNDYQMASYQRADGTMEWFDQFVIKQNNYAKTPLKNIWVSCGWSYEFPVEVEGFKRYTIKPFSYKDMYETPGASMFEGPSKLYNDETGEYVAYL